MTAFILSVASAYPRFKADLELATFHAQAMSCENEQQAGKLAKLYRRTGVQTRGSVLLESEPDGRLTQTFYAPHSVQPGGPTTRFRNDRFAEEAPELACKSSRDAMHQAGVSPPEITHLITVTCTGFAAPGIDVELIDALGLPRTTERIQIGFMGCHALINALRAARGLVAAQADACVLICSVELCSLHYQYGYDAQRIVSGSLFADGAASVLVAGDAFERKPDDADGKPLTRAMGLVSAMGQVSATGSCLIPGSRDAMTWRIGDHGFEMTLQASVPGLIETHLREFLTDWLDRHDQTLESIGGWAVHPGGSRILQAVERALGLPDDALEVSREILRQHGNMSSATLGGVLQEFQRRDVPLPWLMLGFGPGLEIEVALIDR